MTDERREIVRREPAPDGLLLLDKERGPTSADIVRKVSRMLPRKTRIGHAGTLDPDATGLLVLMIGGATKLSNVIMDLPKRYDAVFRFGVETDTYDTTGTVVRERDVGGLTEQQIRAVLPEFTGRILQTPPRYSAVKVKGRRAYELARRGEEPPLQPRETMVYKLDLISFSPPEARFFVVCGKGMYLRGLAHDIGQRLGVGACTAELRRLGIGSLEPTISTRDLTPENWREQIRDGSIIFRDQPVFRLKSRGALSLRRGLPIRADDFLERPREPVGLRTGVLDETGKLIAVAVIGYGGALLERRILLPL
ncbi:MAG: tRNA pseudouridine(55) synthase TruB [Candidatus Hydrogenedentota bacterium]|nr:MAG: tRNA pseudouridine(55) synthase TruB [Candidatus Hydrogenedentota bacterium]